MARRRCSVRSRRCGRSPPAAWPGRWDPTHSSCHSYRICRWGISGAPWRIRATCRTFPTTDRRGAARRPPGEPRRTTRRARRLGEDPVPGGAAAHRVRARPADQAAGGVPGRGHVGRGRGTRILSLPNDSGSSPPASCSVSATGARSTSTTPASSNCSGAGPGACPRSASAEASPPEGTVRAPRAHERPLRSGVHHRYCPHDGHAPGPDEASTPSATRICPRGNCCAADRNHRERSRCRR